MDSNHSQRPEHKQTDGDGVGDKRRSYMAHPAFKGRRQHPGGQGFFWILAACWLVGLFGLGGGRLSSFYVLLLVFAGIVAYWIVAARRRRVSSGRDRALRAVGPLPQTYVVVRKYGKDLRSSAQWPSSAHYK